MKFKYMPIYGVLALACCGLIATDSYAVSKVAAKNADPQYQEALNKHFDEYKEKEYFSGASLSVYIPNQPIKNFYVGRVSHDPTSDKITANTLFQIGSITKSFTAALLLQLEKEKKLRLDDTIGTYLPDYHKWSSITIKQLLNMTSGLPNYSETPLWNTAIYEDFPRIWTKEELIDFVYPKKLNPPIKSGYFYSNTAYVLADLIIEKKSEDTFQKAITERLINAANLTNTFYPVPTIDPAIQARLAHGYNYNQYENPALVGADLYLSNVSWAGAAGAVVSSSEDIIKWVNALFVDKKILDDTQKNKMMTLVSTSTGKPTKQATKQDPQAFGLGIIEMYREPIGRFWFYEGQTLGFRAFYLYKPCNGIIVSMIFNSATDGSNDSIGPFVLDIYTRILKKYPALACKE